MLLRSWSFSYSNGSRTTIPLEPLRPGSARAPPGLQAPLLVEQRGTQRSSCCELGQNEPTSPVLAATNSRSGPRALARGRATPSAPGGTGAGRRAAGSRCSTRATSARERGRGTASFRPLSTARASSRRRCRPEACPRRADAVERLSANEHQVRRAPWRVVHRLGATPWHSVDLGPTNSVMCPKTMSVWGSASRIAAGVRACRRESVVASRNAQSAPSELDGSVAGRANASFSAGRSGGGSYSSVRFASLVGRAVVDDDDLERALCLNKDALDRLGYVRSGVVCPDHHAETRGFDAGIYLSCL